MFLKLGFCFVSLLTLTLLIHNPAGVAASEKNGHELDLAEHRELSAELDYFDFVARATGTDNSEDSSYTKTVTVDQHREQVVPPKHESISTVPVVEKFDTPFVEKAIDSEKKATVLLQENSWDSLKEQAFWVSFDIGAYSTVLFPDPFQLQVFSGLLIWLLTALLLLRREWKKSSRIVLDVYLHQGAEAIQLVEDRYKDQLNLPGEYSLLA